MEAFEMEALIEAHGNEIYSFCKSIARNAYDADDLYQQAFLTALEKSSKIDKNQNPKAFVISVAVLLWKNRMRKLARRSAIAPTVSSDGEYIPDAPTAQDVEERVLSSELKALVDGIVESLSDRFRLPVLLYYTMELSIPEIARALKCPPGTVKSRLHTARMLIKKELEANGYDNQQG